MVKEKQIIIGTTTTTAKYHKKSELIFILHHFHVADTSRAVERKEEVLPLGFFKEETSSFPLLSLLAEIWYGWFCLKNKVSSGKVKGWHWHFVWSLSSWFLSSVWVLLLWIPKMVNKKGLLSLLLYIFFLGFV